MGKNIPDKNEDVLQGDSWYVLKPKKSFVNNENLSHLELNRFIDEVIEGKFHNKL